MRYLQVESKKKRKVSDLMILEKFADVLWSRACQGIGYKVKKNVIIACH
jgi:ribosomal protein L31E